MKKNKKNCLFLSIGLLVAFPIVSSAESIMSEPENSTQPIATGQQSIVSESLSEIQNTDNSDDSATTGSLNIPSTYKNEKVLFKENQAFITIVEKELLLYDEIDGEVTESIKNTDNLLLPIEEKQTIQDNIWLKTKLKNRDVWIKSDSPILLNEGITDFEQSSVSLPDGEGEYFSSFENLSDNISSNIKIETSFSVISSFRLHDEQIFQVLSNDDNSFLFFIPQKKAINSSSEITKSETTTTDSTKENTVSSQQTNESTISSTDDTKSNRKLKLASISVVSSWTTNYSMRFCQGGYGIYNQPLGLPNMVTYGNSSNHMNRAVTITQAKLLSNGDTYYRYTMDNKIYWTDHKAFTEASMPYVKSTWATNYALRFYQGGHGVHNQPWGLANTLTYGNSSNHINRAVTITQAKLLSNGDTYYCYNMDNKTYWTNCKAFTDASNPYVTNTWSTNYALRFYQGGHGIHNQPWGLANTLTYGNSSNHLRKVVTITQAKLLSNGSTYYRYNMDNKTYWTNHQAFIDAIKPYIASTWGTNYPFRIAKKNVEIANTPSPLPNSLTLGNTSNHINRRVLITQAVLLSNGETYYRYSMDNKLYWSVSSAFANRYTSKDILNIAGKYVGVASSPRGSRNNLFNTAFYGMPVSSYTSIYDWCAVYVWYVLREAGLSEEYYGGNKTRWTSPLQTWYKNQNRWSQRPYAGNLVFFSWHDGFTADHVAFIERVNSDGTLTIIDGNVNDDVQRRKVNYVNSWNVVGFGAINYH